LLLMLPAYSLNKIVSKDSATLQGYTAIGIHADHRDIARFASEDDPGFVGISGELLRWTKRIRFDQREEETTAVVAAPTTTSSALAGTGREGCTHLGGIVIHGDVLESNLVNGSQTVYGGLRFG
jgi:hypothetical protein